MMRNSFDTLGAKMNDLLAAADGPDTDDDVSHRRFRAVFVSDIHLGTAGCQAKPLLDFLKHHPSDNLYLIGDIIDGWQLRRRWYWPQAHNDVIQKLLRRARKGCRVVFIPGNHDEFARAFVGHNFGGIEVHKDTMHLTADGRRMWITHGDYFDAVIQRATHPDPDRRFASAAELARELGNIAAMPNRTLRTGSPAVKVTPNVGSPAVSRPAQTAASPSGHNALSRPVRSALPRRTAAPPNPSAATSLRPQGSYNKPKPLAKESSGSGLVVFLVIALIGVAVTYFVMKGKTAAPDSPPQAPPVTEKTTPPQSPAPTAKEEAELDPADLLRRARSSIRQRVGPALESHRRDMKANLSDYRKAMESAAEGLAPGERERISEILSENLRIWENNGDKLPETLPAGFRAVDGAEDVHASHVEKQAAIQSGLEGEIASLASVYVLELQNQLEQIAKGGNARAVTALEEEVRAVEGNVTRFREAMTD
jgi:hypothetical protein